MSADNVEHTPSGGGGEPTSNPATEHPGDVHEMSIGDVKVGPRFRRDLGDIEGLANSISEIGLLHPIVVNADGTLIAGARRLEACKRLGWTRVPVTVVPLEDIAKGEVQENIQRKPFLPSELVAIARAVEPAEKMAAQERHDAQAKVNLGLPDGGKLPPSGSGKTRDKLAAYLGTSGRTLDKAMEVVNAAERNPTKYAPLVEQMDRGGKVDAAFGRLKRMEARDSPQASRIPPGQFQLIYAVPFQQDSMGEDSPGQETCGSVMAMKELKRLTIPAAGDSVLVLQSPPEKLAEALERMRAWGFKYETFAVLDHQHAAEAPWFNVQHDCLLLGVRGNPSPPPPSDTKSNSLITDIGSNGLFDPTGVYRLLEGLVPEGQRLELFVRSNRLGWVSWPEDQDGTVPNKNDAGKEST